MSDYIYRTRQKRCKNCGKIIRVMTPPRPSICSENCLQEWEDAKGHE